MSSSGARPGTAAGAGQLKDFDFEFNESTLLPIEFDGRPNHYTGLLRSPKYLLWACRAQYSSVGSPINNRININDDFLDELEDEKDNDGKSEAGDDNESSFSKKLYTPTTPYVDIALKGNFSSSKYENESRDKIKLPTVAAKSTSSPTATAMPDPCDFGSENDSDDELLSQVNEDVLLEKSQNSCRHEGETVKDPSQRPIILEIIASGTSLQSPNKAADKNQPGSNSGSGDEANDRMEPPKTPYVPKRPSSASSSTTPKSQSSFPFKSQSSHANNEGPSVSSTQSSSSITNTSSSREAFFDNWESDEMSSYEKRLKTIKRRFPGPAGLLPKMSPSEVSLLNDASHPLSQQISKIISSDLLKRQVNSAKELEILAPDREILKIKKAPWRELVKSLKLNPKDPNGLLSLMNIRWVRRKVCKHPVTTKIPFLAMVVQEEPEILGSKRSQKDRRKNPSIKLMDPTGTIVAAMDDRFVEMYGAELHPGTAIAVKNSGFLRFRRQVILTITRKNIICLTSMKNKADALGSEKQVKFSTSPGKIPRRSQQLDDSVEVTETKEGVRVMTFCDFSPSQLMKEYKNIVNTKLDENVGGSAVGENEQSERLFSAFGDSAVRHTVNFEVPVIRTAQATVPAPLKPNFSIDLSVFGDDDDEDLMQALENVDFLMDTDDNDSGA